MKRYLVYFTELSSKHSTPCDQLSRTFHVTDETLIIQRQIADYMKHLKGGNGNRFFIVQSICRTD